MSFLSYLLFFHFLLQNISNLDSFEIGKILKFNGFTLSKQLRRHPTKCDILVRSISTSLQMANDKIGIFYGTSTGNTGEAADAIVEELKSSIGDIDEPIDVDDCDDVVSKLKQYEALIVGTPTWNTGADTERSGTGWDEIYYEEMEGLDLKGKKVAVFGLGDSVSYTENYADATGELHDVLESLGCTMLGYTSQDGYMHAASKAIRGDKFCGLLLDAVNQPDLTETRVKNWVKQILDEGLLQDGDSAVTVQNVAEYANGVSVNDSVDVETTTVLEPNQIVIENEVKKAVEVESNGVVPAGYRPYYNPNTKKTMWISSDGRSCFYTDD